MKLIADLHIHSRHSRATSKELNIKNLEKYAKVKGIGLLGTGDFTHPEWIKEINSELKEDERGILYTKEGFPFVWQTEISLVYTQGGKGRRIHYVLLAPDGGAVKKITDYLLTKGRVDYDGRPIFGINSIELAEKMLELDDRIEVMPAHIWTSWFGIFGSASGFDSMKECFGKKFANVNAIETGMSSDPAMNWRIKELDDYTITSNSDCHSYWPWRMGREANVFEFEELSYDNVLAAIRKGKGLIETIETSPSYGKYHFTGHRLCKVSMTPQESLKHNNICPVCKKKLTVGVMQRVEELASREEGYKPEGAVPFKTLIPLSEIITAVNGGTMYGRKTWEAYYKLVKGRSEYDVLLEMEEGEIKNAVGEKLSDAIMKNREGKLEIKPGYDGEYGKIVMGEEEEEPKPKKQPDLNDFF
ncbi:DNA helicase UvrD [Candidatus Woesearchaeota archaeon]|nr:DNA helicase UvrD [Candidatus Woesearchaeota archaeon]